MKNPIAALFHMIFGCRHKNISWPQYNPKHRSDTYVTCFDCCQEVSYKFPEAIVSANKTVTV